MSRENTRSRKYRSKRGREEDEQQEYKQSEVTLGFGYRPLIDHVPKQTIARCSFNKRYHMYENWKDALKYSPVNCTEIYDPEACEQLRQKRGSSSLKFKFNCILAPSYTEYERKIMVVPSVGCPSTLLDEHALNQLLWPSLVKDRPVYLSVHQSEIEQYKNSLEEKLAGCGVGLVGWSCTRENTAENMVGFAVSRLAAQQYALLVGKRSDVILSDVNVLNSKNVQDGYDTDNEKKKKDGLVWGQQRYRSVGRGTGFSTKTLTGNKIRNSRKTIHRGGLGRPLEQVVIINDEMLYDPCFITSSEDEDMTDEMLYENGLKRGKRSGRDRSRLRWPGNIDKLEFENFSDDYMKLRDTYLQGLSHEDEVLVEYSEGGECKVMTVGELAKNIASEHNLDPVVIRSLIIEKILVQYKYQCRGRINLTEPSQS